MQGSRYRYLREIPSHQSLCRSPFRPGFHGRCWPATLMDEHFGGWDLRLAALLVPQMLPLTPASRVRSRLAMSCEARDLVAAERRPPSLPAGPTPVTSVLGASRTCGGPPVTAAVASTRVRTRISAAIRGSAGPRI